MQILQEFCKRKMQKSRSTCAGFSFVRYRSLVEIIIHNILYLRAVYPAGNLLVPSRNEIHSFGKDLFEKFKKYDVPVYKSRHPQLNNYIAEVVKNSMTNIVKVSLIISTDYVLHSDMDPTQGIVKKVVVAVKDGSTDQVLEHFVLSLLWIKNAAFFEEANANARRQ